MFQWWSPRPAALVLFSAQKLLISRSQAENVFVVILHYYHQSWYLGEGGEDGCRETAMKTPLRTAFLSRIAPREAGKGFKILRSDQRSRQTVQIISVGDSSYLSPVSIPRRMHLEKQKKDKRWLK